MLHVFSVYQKIGRDDFHVVPKIVHFFCKGSSLGRGGTRPYHLLQCCIVARGVKSALKPDGLFPIESAAFGGNVPYENFSFIGARAVGRLHAPGCGNRNHQRPCHWEERMKFAGKSRSKMPSLRVQGAGASIREVV